MILVWKLFGLLTVLYVGNFSNSANVASRSGDRRPRRSSQICQDDFAAFIGRAYSATAGPAQSPEAVDYSRPSNAFRSIRIAQFYLPNP